MLLTLASLTRFRKHNTYTDGLIKDSSISIANALAWWQMALTAMDNIDLIIP